MENFVRFFVRFVGVLMVLARGALALSAVVAGVFCVYLQFAIYWADEREWWEDTWLFQVHRAAEHLGAGDWGAMFLYNLPLVLGVMFVLMGAMLISGRRGPRRPLP